MKKARKGVKHMLPRNKETTFDNRDLFLMLLCLWQDLTNQAFVNISIVVFVCC
jgi:hypothetical protein